MGRRPSNRRPSGLTNSISILYYRPRLRLCLWIATGTHNRREEKWDSKQRPPGQQTTQSNLKPFALDDAVAIGKNLAKTLFRSRAVMVTQFVPYIFVLINLFYVIFNLQLI